MLYQGILKSIAIFIVQTICIRIANEFSIGPFPTRNFSKYILYGIKSHNIKEILIAKEKVLLFTYSQEEQGVFFEDLISWVEYQNKADFKSKVLNPLHKEGMIEFDKELNMIFLSPREVKK